MFRNSNSALYGHVFACAHFLMSFFADFTEVSACPFDWLKPGEEGLKTKPQSAAKALNSSESKGVQEDSNPEPEAMEETVMPLSPKIKVALQAMENMGFNNDNDWLSDLLMKYNGDIGKVLDLISKRN